MFKYRKMHQILNLQYAFFQDEFSKEDLAAALLQMVATDICQVLGMVHQRIQFKRVFWCGSFIKAEVVRKYLTLEWRRRSAFAGKKVGKVR